MLLTVILIIISFPSPTHSFIPGLKPSFSANPREMPPAPESSKQEATNSFRWAHGELRTGDAECVEFEAPRVETPKVSRGWGMGTEYPPLQPTMGSGGAS